LNADVTDVELLQVERPWPVKVLTPQKTASDIDRFTRFRQACSKQSIDAEFTPTRRHSG